MDTDLLKRTYNIKALKQKKVSREWGVGPNLTNYGLVSNVSPSTDLIHPGIQHIQIFNFSNVKFNKKVASL